MLDLREQISGEVFNILEGEGIDSTIKLYLCAIIDLYDTSIVVYKMGQYDNNKLVFDTLASIMNCNLEAKPLFHNDCGFQYTSKAFQC